MLRPAALTALALVLVACGGAGKDKAADANGTDGPANITPASTQSGKTDTPANATATPLPSADPALVEFYKRLHATPELSFRESETSAILANELQTLGFEVTTGIGQDWVVEKSMKDNGEVLDGVGGYGVVGVFRNGNGPTILIRTDMDALPVPEQTGLPFASTVEATTWTGVESYVMHACGHDVHMTSWVGTARELIARKNKWKGTLVMIAQPAEEIGLGAQAMLADGLYTRFPKPDYNLALHVSAAAPAGTINYSSGFALANVDSVDIKVKGVGGHGAYPHTTRDPILVASHIVVALQSLVSRNTNPQDSAVVTVGSFKSGAKHNIISDEANLLLTVRSYDDATRKMLLDGISRIARAEAMAFDAPEPEITIESDYTPATYNDPDTTARTMKAIGKSIGAANVREMKPVMGGEDFSQYARTQEQIPSVIFWVGAVEPAKFDAAQNGGPSLPSLHSSGFAPDYDPTIATGVEAMTAAAIELFKD
ncbi:amidohydrolase [Hyphomonas sp.]|uniref:amidohydrolase n=1 Tax=Hyphomonas sp. TaxID=87 RepID=UPI0032EF522D|tara:strand:- start:8604 stop:10058 length:1455 start_codon:yes stop_codon:yes gene_type:complete